MSGKALLPPLQSAGTYSAAHNPSARLGFKTPPGSEISTCRADPAVEGVPGHIQAPFLPGTQEQPPSHSPSCPSCATHTNPCTAPVPSCALQSSLNHSSVTTRDQPGESHCPTLLLQSSARQATSSTFSFQLQAQVLLPQRFSSPSRRLRHGAQGSKGHKWLVRTAVPDSAIQSPGRSREVIFSLAQAERDRELPPKAAAGSWMGAPCHELFPSQPFDFPAFPGSPAGPGESALPQSVPQECPTSTASCHCRGAITECWGTPSPREEPHTSTLEHVLLERCGTGETATPTWRPREFEEASGEEEESR